MHFHLRFPFTTKLTITPSQAPQLTHTFFSSILVIQYFLYNKSGVEEKKEEKKEEEKKEEDKKEE